MLVDVLSPMFIFRAICVVIIIGALGFRFGYKFGYKLGYKSGREFGQLELSTQALEDIISDIPKDEKLQV